VLRILLATRSHAKAREIREILAGAPEIDLLTLNDLHITPSPQEEHIEVFSTFRENAFAKARYFAELSGLLALADDSGLAVDALDGAPGVLSRRFSGHDDLDGIALDQANNDLLLRRLHDVPDPRRTAHYRCVAALASPRRPIVACFGSCTGAISRDPRGNDGFGYDPLFLIPDLDFTFAQVSTLTKHRLSHRGRAFRALAAVLPRISFGA